MIWTMRIVRGIWGAMGAYVGILEGQYLAQLDSRFVGAVVGLLIAIGWWYLPSAVLAVLSRIDPWKNA